MAEIRSVVIARQGSARVKSLAVTLHRGNVTKVVTQNEGAWPAVATAQVRLRLMHSVSTLKVLLHCLKRCVQSENSSLRISSIALAFLSLRSRLLQSISFLDSLGSHSPHLHRLSTLCRLLWRTFVGTARMPREMRLESFNFLDPHRRGLVSHRL